MKYKPSDVPEKKMAVCCYANSSDTQWQDNVDNSATSASEAYTTITCSSNHLT